MSSQDTGARRAALSDTKRALLEARLRGAAPAAAAFEGVTRMAGPGPEHPASFAQERMFFLSEMAPDSPMYNVPLVWLLRADVDVDVLARALTGVVRRHEALRTTFSTAGGELRQVVRDPAPVPVQVRDVRARVGADWLADARALAAEALARPLPPLTQGPVLRAELLRVTNEQSVLVLTFHHVAVDGWAVGEIANELHALYEAFAEGRPSPLPEPALRYADYAVWQRQRLQGPALERLSAFWREHLAGAPILELPTDRARPAVPSHEGRAHRFSLSTRATAGLRALCAAEQASLNMGMVAALAALLSRWAGQDRVVLGTVAAGRGRPELEPIVGLFVNTLALSVDLSGDPGFREVLRRARATVFATDRHQEMPFERVVELLGVQRDPARSPVFQAFYSHVAWSDAQGRGGRLDPRPLESGEGIEVMEASGAQFDLAVTSQERGDRIGILLEYAADLFDAATMRRLGDHLDALLAAATAAPDTPLSTLEWVDADERAALLAASTGPEAGDDDGRSAHALIREQARRAPSAVAVSADGVAVTYGALDAWANRIAGALRERGIGRGDVVGLHLDRTPSTIAAILGVLNAGAAYVPIGPTLPEARVRFMLADTGARLVITDSAPATALPPDAPPVLACPPAPGSGETVEAVSVDVDDRDRAYLIYTSGSTGRPKAVEVEHGNLRRYVRSATQALGLSADDVVLGLATASFDMSVLDVFGTLAAGGRLVLAPEGLGADGTALARTLEREEITFAQATPATWRILVQSGWSGRRGMRLLSAGETLPAPLAAELAEQVDAVWNAYGPTEATVCATLHPVRVPVPDPVPIGTPAPGARTYVLDAGLHLCATGIPGELCVGGAGVARGYLGRPALTAEKFVPDPFAGAPGARMYRTGDRTRWREDGTLAFLGRLDAQVKLRGYRVEPGEIESELLRHPALTAAAVVLREDVPGDARLIGYVVANDGAAPGGAELRAHLRERLPEYMVPSAFVPLAELPLSVSGKVDRHALPAPDAAEGEAEAYVAPRTAVEDLVAEIWAEVLRRERISVTESFFDLGGHSLLATQVLVRINETFEVEIPLRDFFQAPTIAGLAAAVESAGSPVLAAMVDELAGLSAEEIETLLAEEGA
jgi:amino acid adenylation domain-containing protein